MSKFNIGIIGNGFVGSATSRFRCDTINVKIFDTNLSKSDCLHISDLGGCDAIFICVPTPMKASGESDTSIVESVINDVKLYCPSSTIIVRSTVPVGFCKKHGVCFAPEFLTEANWEYDFFNTDKWIFGFDIEPKFNFMDFLFEAWRFNKIASCSFKLTDTASAELLKYIRNTFLAVKVSYFNEIYDFCQKLNMNYNEVSSLACEDERIGKSHIKVPGPDGKKGFGGTCFPKDMNSLLHQMNSAGINSYIISGAINRNINEDRPEKDWENLKGRAVV